jgi:hypothetical protein
VQGLAQQELPQVELEPPAALAEADKGEEKQEE